MWCFVQSHSLTVFVNNCCVLYGKNWISCVCCLGYCISCMFILLESSMNEKRFWKVTHVIRFSRGLCSSSCCIGWKSIISLEHIPNIQQHTWKRTSTCFPAIASADVPPIKFTVDVGVFLFLSAECHLRKIYFADKGVHINHKNRNSFPFRK